MTDPRADGAGVALCIEKALHDAGIAKEKIDYVNAHATSTLVGDVCEINALKRVFGEQMARIKVNATKSMIGHCLGAAGGIEAIATIKAIETGCSTPPSTSTTPFPKSRGSMSSGGAQSPIKFTPHFLTHLDLEDIIPHSFSPLTMVEEVSFGVIPLMKDNAAWQVFLILHKSGNHWGFPKGHASGNETPQETATRELKRRDRFNRRAVFADRAPHRAVPI